MSLIIKRPLTEEQKKYLANKDKPTQEDVRQAEDALFMSILLRLNALEDKANGSLS